MINILDKNTRIVYLYEKQGKKCAYCQELLFDKEGISKPFNIDHDLPLSRGGKDTIENVVLACRQCNSDKANMTGEEYRRIMDKVRSGAVSKKDIGDYAKYLVLKSKFKDW